MDITRVINKFYALALVLGVYNIEEIARFTRYCSYGDMTLISQYVADLTRESFNEMVDDVLKNLLQFIRVFRKIDLTKVVRLFLFLYEIDSAWASVHSNIQNIHNDLIASQIETIADLKKWGPKVAFTTKYVMQLLMINATLTLLSEYRGDGRNMSENTPDDFSIENPEDLPNNNNNNNPVDPSDEDIKYIDEILKSTKLYPTRNGLGLRFYMETNREVSTRYVIDAIYRYLRKSATCYELLNKSGQLSITFNLHNSQSWLALNNSLIANNTTTLEVWRSHWLEGLKKRNESGYEAELAIAFDLKLYTIKSPKPGFSISPLKPRVKYNNKIATLDLETITLSNNTLLPYAGGFKLKTARGKNIERLYYLTDYLKEDLDNSQSSNKMLLHLCTDLLSLSKGYTVYVHNLGGFDGVFLLKPLVELLGPFRVIMDKSKDFISLSLPNKIVFKDSYRIFPASLASLSSLFDVPIPKGFLDHNKIQLNNLIEVRAEVEAYLRTDLTSLYDVMGKASSDIFNKYGVDLSTVFSASSLAMKIFRTAFLKTNIPLLPSLTEKAIRSGYRGGATQLFKHAGTNLHYYDINSLYPFAMTKPMPHYYLGRLQWYEINLYRFFGFLDVEIFAPNSIKVPILPFLASDAD